MNDIKVKTLIDMINDKSELPAPVIADGILLEKSLLLIIGEAKSGKSFLSMNFGLALANGEDFAGFVIPESRRVLYLPAEGGYFPNRERIKVIAHKLDVEYPENFMFANIAYLPINEDSSFEALKKAIEEYEPEVLILDPFIKFHSVDENSSSLIAGVFGRLRRLMDKYNFSVILPHHTGKISSRGGRGTSAIRGEYDSSIMIYRKDNHYLFSFETRHVESPLSRKLFFNIETFWFEYWTDTDFIFKYLEEHGPISRADTVKEWVNNEIYSESHSYRLINKAMNIGRIKEENGLLSASLGSQVKER